MGRQAADGAAKGAAAAAVRLNGRLRAVEGTAAGCRRRNLEESANPPQCAAGCESLRCGEVFGVPIGASGALNSGLRME